MKNLLVIGKTGQIASSLLEILVAQGKFKYTALGRNELDLARPKNVYAALKKIKPAPDIIINAAAYTDVDKAEDEREICNNINNLAVAEIASFCADNKALLVHYSTDYVFDGSGNQEFSEDNITNLKPVNYYGATKLAAESAVINSGCDYLILRTSWVYNHRGKNFVNTILKLAAAKTELKIVADQVGSPTYAHDIAAATLQMLENIKPGIYHMVPHEKVSWHQFAEMIIDEAKRGGLDVKLKTLTPITTAEYKTKAKRPLNSRLSAQKLKTVYNIQLPPLAASLRICLGKIRK